MKHFISHKFALKPPEKVLLLLKVHKVSTDFPGEGHQDKAEEEGEKWNIWR